MNSAMFAIIKKDFRSITSNRNLFASLLIVPLVLAVVLPSVFVCLIHFAPDDPDIQKLMELLPRAAQSESLELAAAGLIFNYILPVFFLMIPIMAASIMAASSFVGEKERRTLETLLYCPLSVKQIFRSKVLASFLLSMAVTFLSFFSMILVLEIEIFLLMDSFLLPGINWLLLLILVAPAVTMIAITLIVRGSAKARSVEESQQSAVFLVIPVILLAVGQFTGVLLLSPWLLFGLGMVCAVIAWILLKKCTGRFTYEMLLS
ncbi:MAG TPA: ABC transporter permease subunit [Candidatus Choladousia intestinipullorum]|nr:ABC transporter permease subunit [Candidatus Choladousia intestinipullorum]